nr:hypothetical protein [uncultured Flavobacterium sp.]
MHCTSRRTFIKQTGLDFTAVLLPLGLVSLEKYNILEDGSFFDVIIIDGSYAVLSAGMTLGRTLKKVLIVDSGHPCNIQAPH